MTPLQMWRAAAIFAVMAGGVRADPVVTVHQDWVSVVGDGACYLRHAIIDPRDRVLLAAVMLAPDGAGALLTVDLPSGASLAVPAALRLPDGRAQALAWQFCRPELCSALALMPVADVMSLLAADQAQLAFRPLPDSAPLVLPVSLSGITAGWSDLAACQNG